jgi:hypothetical protein
MRQYLKDLTKCRPGQKMSDVLTAKFINSIVDAIHGLARGENIIPSPNLLLKKGDGWVSISPIAKPTTDTRKPEPKPWDIYSLTSEGSGDTYKAKLWPGLIGGLMPTNMSQEFTVAGDGYFIATGTSSGFALSSFAISFESGNPPPPAVPTKGQPPTGVKVILGAYLGGLKINLWGRNIQAYPREVGQTDRPNPSLTQSRWEKWYVWEVA